MAKGSKLTSVILSFVVILVLTAVLAPRLMEGFFQQDGVVAILKKEEKAQQETLQKKQKEMDDIGKNLRELGFKSRKTHNEILAARQKMVNIRREIQKKESELRRQKRQEQAKPATPASAPAPAPAPAPRP